MDNYMLDDAKLDKLLQKIKKKKIKTCHIFSLKSKIQNESELKMCLLHYQHKTNRCDKCKQVGFWNKKPLDLLVYRKNKNTQDNRLENLQLLCPNCYSQTQNQKLWIKLNQSKMLVCVDCGKKFKKKKFKKIVDPCANIGLEDSNYDKLILAPASIHTPKRCTKCIEVQIQKKDYTRLEKIKKSKPLSNIELLDSIIEDREEELNTEDINYDNKGSDSDNDNDNKNNNNNKIVVI